MANVLIGYSCCPLTREAFARAGQRDVDVRLVASARRFADASSVRHLGSPRQAMGLCDLAPHVHLSQ